MADRTSEKNVPLRRKVESLERQNKRWTAIVEQERQRMRDVLHSIPVHARHHVPQEASAVHVFAAVIMSIEKMKALGRGEEPRYIIPDGRE